MTLVAVAERREIPLHGLEVDGTGHVEQRDDGHFGFVAIELHASVETDEASLDAAKEAAGAAKELCLVSIALDTPVHVEVEVTARAATARKEAVA